MGAEDQETQILHADFGIGQTCEIPTKLDVGKVMGRTLQPTIDYSRYLPGVLVTGSSAFNRAALTAAQVLSTYSVPKNKSAIITGGSVAGVVTAGTVSVLLFYHEILRGDNLKHRIYVFERRTMNVDDAFSVKYSCRIPLEFGDTVRTNVSSLAGTGETVQMNAGQDIVEYCAGIDKV